MNKPKNHMHQPPGWPLRLLQFFVRKEYLEEIEGDMEEIFQDYLETYTLQKARRIYLREVFQLARPALVKNILGGQQLNLLAMFKHNIILSLRGFKRYKTAFAINLTGLSTALAASFCIFLWINAELSVDKFHEKDDRLFQVMQNSENPDGVETDNGSPALLAAAMIKEMPEVEYAVTTNNRGIGSTGLLGIDDRKTKVKGLFASSDFFRLFSYPLIQGNANQALENPNAILLSANTALQLFGTLDKAMGQTIESNKDLYAEQFIVTGIFEDPPATSTSQFDFIANYDLVFKHEEWVNEWSGDGAITYISLKPGTDEVLFNEKIEGFILDKPYRDNNRLFIQQYSSRYLYGNYENGMITAGRIAYVRILGVAAIFILLVAAINFMNLSTAQATRRMKEVGVKKVFGAKRSLLIGRFITESLLMTLFSCLLALVLTILFLPKLNELTGKELALDTFSNMPIYIGIITLLMAMISGVYPALYLSAFPTLKAVKGKLTGNFKDLWMRKGLVVFQFVISILFIISFWVIHEQIQFIRNTELGYTKEGVIHFQVRQRIDRQVFLLELKNLPGVENATNLSGGSIVDLKGSGSGFSWGDPSSQEEILFRRPHVGYDFIETSGIQLIAGRSFSREFSNEETKLIINEAAAKLMGMENPVGQKILDSSKEKEIIGVVKNFKIKSLYDPMQPCIMRFTPNGWNVMVKLRPTNEVSALAQIEDLYNQFSPEYPFSPRYLEDQYAGLYATEQRVAGLAKYFTIIAMLISCLGLFGLATFTAERRIKEIGIRKVLGAGSMEILRLLSVDFTKLVVAAVIIALPLGYLATSGWLSDFAYHIKLQWWFFAGAGVGAILLSLLTIGLRSLHAAQVNPVSCLRNE